MSTFLCAQKPSFTDTVVIYIVCHRIEHK